MPPRLSAKGDALIALYEHMATEGYDRTDGKRAASAFNGFELRAHRRALAPVLREHGVRAVLDYGSGGSDRTAG